MYGNESRFAPNDAQCSHAVLKHACGQHSFESSWRCRDFPRCQSVCNVWRCQQILQPSSDGVASAVLMPALDVLSAIRHIWSMQLVWMLSKLYCSLTACLSVVKYCCRSDGVLMFKWLMCDVVCALTHACILQDFGSCLGSNCDDSFWPVCRASSMMLYLSVLHCSMQTDIIQGVRCL